MTNMYVVQYEKLNGTKGNVLTNEDNGPCEVEMYRTVAEAEAIAQEMRDAHSYTGMKYSVVEVGKDWK